MKTAPKSLIIGAVLAGTQPAAAAPELTTRQALTMEAAQAMIQGCLDHAAGQGMPPVSIAVMDDGGNLVAFTRQT